MKFSRWIWGTATLAVLLIVVTLSAVIAARRVTTQAQDHSQTQDETSRQRRDARSEVWRPNTRRLNAGQSRSSNAGVDVNLLGIPDQADWIVGAAPAQGSQEEEVVIGIIRWRDSGASNRRRIEQIERIEDYPTDLVDVTPDAVTVRGSDALAGATLVVFLTVSPETQLRLSQDGRDVGRNNPSFRRRGFAVINGRPVGFPISGLHTVLAYLQTDRIARGVGRRPEEVIRRENR